MNEDCLKLTTYFGERDRTEHRLLADELLDLYGSAGVQTSILVRGIDGFGAHHSTHTDRLLTLSEDLPLVSVAADTSARIDALLPEVLAIKRRGLLTLERARLLSGTLTDIRDPADLPVGLHEAIKLTVYIGRQERVAGRPAFVAICDLLHRHGIDGATALLGVDGTMYGRRERARFFDRNAAVPMMVIAVGSGAAIAAVMPQLEQILARPLATLERVRVCRRDGERLADPQMLPPTDEHGLAMWQKLMIHSSEAHRVAGHPLHRELIHRLRAENIAGATSIRGVWGFHGDHQPHGDRLLQARRHTPVLTIVVDTPERIAGAFRIVEEITATSGLVTVEMVPASAAPAELPDGHRLRLARHRY